MLGWGDSGGEVDGDGASSGESEAERKLRQVSV